jgi:exopolysaccharide biosynthesis protein
VPGEAKDLIGLSIAQGETVSPHIDAGQRDVFIFEAGVYDDSSMDVILLPEDSLGQLASFAPTHAIAGRAVLIGGELQVGDDKFSTDWHPRTLVGLSDDQNTLYLVAIDGRQPAFSTGASLAEAAAIMAFLGAADALNADGGGSTTMVLRDPDGASQLLNSPSSGFERVVGSNLGLRARPLQPGSTPVGYNSEDHRSWRESSCCFPDLFSF